MAKLPGLQNAMITHRKMIRNLDCIASTPECTIQQVFDYISAKNI